MIAPDGATATQVANMQRALASDEVHSSVEWLIEEEILETPFGVDCKNNIVDELLGDVFHVEPQFCDHVIDICRARHAKKERQYGQA